MSERQVRQVSVRYPEGIPGSVSQRQGGSLDPLTPDAACRPRPIAEVLETIAQRLRNLGPDHRDPERFHRDKSDLVHELRRLARRAA